MGEMEFPTPDVAVETVEPTELKTRIDNGEPVTLLDVRMASEYDTWRIDGDSVDSINIPYFNFLDEEVDTATLEQLPADEPMTVVCAKGGASAFVAGRLTELGYEVDNLAEGMNGWAGIYEAVEITNYDGPGTLVQYQRPSSGCLAYMIYDGTEAAVIDPLRAFTDRYLEDAADLDVELTYAFDTHIHADHISGLRKLAAEGVESVISAAAADRGLTYASEVTLTEDGDTFTVGEVTIETVFTPGHTTGMTSYLIGDSLLATGDGLFIESVARPDLEDGDDGAPKAARVLYDSLQYRILEQDEETLIGGAHFSSAAEPMTDGSYTAPLGDLIRRMDALSMDEQEFVELVLSDMPPRPANYLDIIETNLGQQDPDDEEAFTLELGPNNCAASQDALTSD